MRAGPMSESARNEKKYLETSSESQQAAGTRVSGAEADVMQVPTHNFDDENEEQGSWWPSRLTGQLGAFPQASALRYVGGCHAAASDTFLHLSGDGQWDGSLG